MNRSLTHGLVIGCTLLFGVRELLALQRLRWGAKLRRRQH